MRGIGIRGEEVWGKRGDQPYLLVTAAETYYSVAEEGGGGGSGDGDIEYW
jgi:hypothetical protein